MTIAHGGGPHLGLQGDFILPVDYQDVLIPFQWHTAFRGELPTLNTASLVADTKFYQVLSVPDSARIQYAREFMPPKDFTLNLWIAHTGDTRIANNAYKLFALGMDVPTAMLTLWNYNPLGTDTRKIIADFGNNASSVRQSRDLISGTPFVTNAWEMITVTFNYSTLKFTFYRNGKLWDSYTPTKLNAITAIELYNSGWKYADLLICPRIASDQEIEGWFNYGKRMYDPYDYTVIYG